MTTPQFSIIMTSYNYAPYIGAAIESVLGQTLGDWELLVVDDCSTDDSWKIITGFDDPRIKAYRHVENLGACAAYNQGLALATGANIACLDSDDVFLPTKLERQAVFLDEHPEVGICGTFITEIDRDGHAAEGCGLYSSWFNVPAHLNDPACWLWENRLCHSSTVVRADIHRRLGEFDGRFTYTPDWQFWLRALTSGVRFAVDQDRLTGYRSHDSNITHKNPDQTILEHAMTSAEILFPWLYRSGRPELVETSLLRFLSYTFASRDIAQAIGERLFAGSHAFDTAVSLLHLTRVKLQVAAEVAEGKAWIEDQVRALQAELAAARHARDSIEEQTRMLQTELAAARHARDSIENQSRALQAELADARQARTLIEGEWQQSASQLAGLRAAFGVRLLTRLGLIKH